MMMMMMMKNGSMYANDCQAIIVNDQTIDQNYSSFQLLLLLLNRRIGFSHTYKR